MAGNEYEALRALVQSSSRMRAEMDAMRVSFDNTTNDLLKVIDRVTLERDEARREVCELLWKPLKSEDRIIALPHELAKIRGWDCYEGRTDASS